MNATRDLVSVAKGKKFLLSLNSNPSQSEFDMHKERRLST